MLSLKVINLVAGPSAGKSTLAAGLFNLMKAKGHSVELVSEVAKDLVYERNFTGLANHLFTLAAQDLRLRRLEGHVEWAITDSPLPLVGVYATPEYDWVEETAWEAFDRYRNFSFFVERGAWPYQREGRMQTHSEALALDLQVREVARLMNIRMTVRADQWAPYDVARDLGLLKMPLGKVA